MPHVLAGTDVLVQAKSGTGKTLVIACAALRHCEQDGGRQPQVLPRVLRQSAYLLRQRASSARDAVQQLRSIQPLR